MFYLFIFYLRERILFYLLFFSLRNDLLNRYIKIPGMIIKFNKDIIISSKLVDGPGSSLLFRK